MSVPLKQRIQKLKENNAHVILGPTKHNQGNV